MPALNPVRSVLGLVFVSAVVATAGAQQTAGSRPTGAAEAPRAAEYVPLVPGATWDYAVVDGEGRTHERRESVALPVRVAAAGRCFELAVSAPDGYAYRGYRDDGVYAWKNAYLGGLRGVDRASEPTPVLLDPLRVGASWKRTAHLSYQTSGDAPHPSEAETRYETTWTIESLDDPVATPDGERPAVRVREAAVGGHWSTTTVSWYVRGVGLVRETLDSRWNADRSSRTTTLKAFAPGAFDAADDARGRLADQLRVLPPWAGSPAPTIVALDAPAFAEKFRAKFFVVSQHDGARRAVYYVAPQRRRGARLTSGSMGALSPTDAGGWNTLLADDVFRLGRGAAGSHAAAELAVCVGLVHAALRCGSAAQSTLGGGEVSRTVVDESGALTAEVAVAGKRFDGGAYAARVKLTVVDGKVTKIEVVEAT